MFNTQSSLQSLIEALEGDIRENPDRRLIELAALRETLAKIRGETVGPQQEAPAAKVREGSKKMYFRSVVSQLIEQTERQRVHRSTVIDTCRALGMFGATKDIDRDVSKYLSMDGTFAPAGEGHWRKKTFDELVAHEVTQNENGPQLQTVVRPGG